MVTNSETTEEKKRFPNDNFNFDPENNIRQSLACIAKNFNKYDRDKSGTIDPSKASFKPGQFVETRYRKNLAKSRRLFECALTLSYSNKRWLERLLVILYH